MPKVVLVTGASSGIGHEIAAFLHNKGYIVYGLSRRESQDVPFHTIRMDVTRASSIQEAVEKIITKENRIDVLINNAGMGISGSVEDTPVEDAKYLFDVNFFGAFQVSKYVIPYMRTQGSGKIINVSSLAANFPIPFQAFYSASKAALSTMSHALHNELKPFNVFVSVILPGDIKTAFSSQRKKNRHDHVSYGDRVKRSIETMEKDEANGMDPVVIANYVYKLIKMKHMPIESTVGMKYKLLLWMKRFLPITTVNHILGKMYGFLKKK